MKVLLIFLFFLAVLVGIVALGLKYFKWIIKTRQEKKKPDATKD